MCFAGCFAFKVNDFTRPWETSPENGSVPFGRRYADRAAMCGDDFFSDEKAKP
jgi:hypothetical protein